MWTSNQLDRGIQPTSPHAVRRDAPVVGTTQTNQWKQQPGTAVRHHEHCGSARSEGLCALVPLLNPLCCPVRPLPNQSGLRSVDSRRRRRGPANNRSVDDASLRAAKSWRANCSSFAALLFAILPGLWVWRCKSVFSRCCTAVCDYSRGTATQTNCTPVSRGRGTTTGETTALLH